MSNVIDFVQYKKERDSIYDFCQEEWTLLDAITIGLGDTTSFTLTLADGEGNILWNSDTDRIT